MNTAPEIPKAKAKVIEILRVYTFALLVVGPALVILHFSTIFLLPKALAVWKSVGLDHSKADWFMETTRFLAGLSPILIYGSILGAVSLELGWTRWQKWRPWAIGVAAATFNAIVLATVTMLSIAALLAVPLLEVKARKAMSQGDQKRGAQPSSAAAPEDGSR